MGSENYSKEEKEFYESIMREIRMHQDFGKRNPVDIGMDCGYSEDDVMKMISMCKDIVDAEIDIPAIEAEQEQEASKKKKTKKWDLNNYISRDEFMTLQFPKDYRTSTQEVNWQVDEAMDAAIISRADILTFLQYADELKKYGSLHKAEKHNIQVCINNRGIVDGLDATLKWAGIYATIHHLIEIGKKKNEIVSSCGILGVDAIYEIIKLIKLEKKYGYSELDKMIISQMNGGKTITDNAEN